MRTKTCTECGEEKPLADFHKRAASKDGRVTWCKTCTSNYHRDWYRRNSVKRLEQSRRWNRENADQKHLNNLLWRSKNTDKVRIWNARNKAELLGLPSEEYSFDQVVERSGGICGICREPVDLVLEYPDPASRSLDHIIPYSKGGPNYLSNTQLAHHSCNVQKHDKLPEEIAYEIAVRY